MGKLILSHEELCEIRSDLPRGSRAKIARDIGKSTALVNAVLWGQRSDYHGIIDRAIRMIKESVNQDEKTIEKYRNYKQRKENLNR